MDEIGKKLSISCKISFHFQDITNLKDWYFISHEQLKRAGGGGVYMHFRSWHKLLTTAYPEYLLFLL